MAQPCVIQYIYGQGRAFERVFCENTLDEMMGNIKRKLECKSDSVLHLLHIRNNIPLQLSDEQDFQAFRILASRSEQLCVRVTLVQETSPGLRRAAERQSPAKEISQNTESVHETQDGDGGVRADVHMADVTEEPDIVITDTCDINEENQSLEALVPQPTAGGDQQSKAGYVLQEKKCTAFTRFKSIIPTCVSCRAKKGDDKCRFQNLREIKSGDDRNPIGVQFRSAAEGLDKGLTRYKSPDKWNVSPTKQQLADIQLAVAQYLLPMLREEQTLREQQNPIYKPVEPGVRVTCDFCQTSLLFNSYICTWCGRDFCQSCLTDLRTATPIELRPDQERGTKQERQLRSCAKRPLRYHRPEDFRLTTPFQHQELEQYIKDMEDLVNRATVSYNQPNSKAASNIPPISCSFTEPNRQMLTDVPTHPMATFSTEPSEADFKVIWAQGTPIVIRGLLQNFSIRWSPEYFIEHYGDQPCQVVDCENDQDLYMLVREFFCLFGKEQQSGVLKLKDWPPQSAFMDTFQDLFQDFAKAVPIPNYTRRDGILNIASHFAMNDNPPDLGPKMYNALASSESKGGHGSTRLHMDVADAVNIMMYASPDTDGSSGVAVWDIFQDGDSDKIRDYLRRHFPEAQALDPIHSQLFYLNPQHREQLYKEEKVQSWRFYQQPGDAVFIPAGCAHQVCNLADCIKVAADFVSVENISRCRRLTSEFRNVNLTNTWKSDVLQLQAMMMHAWRSTCHLASDKDEARAAIV